MRARQLERVAWALATLAGLALPALGQYGPPATGGMVALDGLLQQLASGRRLLLIGAHPDDEDTELLALAVQRDGADAAYLSLSRGEGGQNILGDELGVALGLIRTRELEAARRIDGARQFFTRAFDFGFSRSLTETERFWPPDSVLKDAVRIVRRFRPHVIVSTWSGTPRDGHGQHQMAGVIARRAFDVAGDSTAFPELWREERLAPWQPLKFYRSTYFDTTQATLVLETGGLDARSGRSYHQIAMASRSQHRSQDMGRLQDIGPRRTRLRLEIDRTGQGAGDLWAGVPGDTSSVARAADSLRHVVTAATMADAVEPLLAALERGRRTGLAPERIELLERAVAIAAGLVLDAVADREAVVPGSALEVTAQVYNAGRFAARVDRVDLSVPTNWAVEIVSNGAGALPSGRQVIARMRVVVPPREAPSQPYFLQRPLSGALYDWEVAPPPLRGLPFEPPPVTAVATVSLAQVPVRLVRPAAYRSNDPTRGELRRALRVAPPVELWVEPELLVWSSSGSGTQRIAVRLRQNGDAPVEGTVRLDAGEWGRPASAPFALARRGESERVEFELVRPDGKLWDRVIVRAAAHIGDATYGVGSRRIDYPHIDPVVWFEPAQTTVVLAPIALPAGGPIGYVRGAADRVPEALRSVGLPLELLDDAALAGADLGRFAAIVIGSRAYEVNPVLQREHPRLLEYVRRGGHLVVQYQQYEFVRGGFAPYPLEIRRPHDRVTDETAPVRVLLPDHPVFRTPNRLTPADWEEWPQERGLYFAGTWDERYVPLIETADPGQAPLRGGLLYARYGNGTYIYTGLSFFRALPAGTPGAFRLFMNLLALGEQTARP